MTTSGSPRIAPLKPEERDEFAKALLSDAFLPEANIFTTLVRHPGLFRRWLPFGGKLLNGKLAARERELLILRTGWNCGSEYEWAQHVLLGRDAGLTDDEIRRLRQPDVVPLWGAGDALLVRAADELHSTSTISDEVWSGLTTHLSIEQLIELPMLVGHYHLVAMTLNALGVQLDEGLHGFDRDSP